MCDRIVRASTANSMVRAFAITGRDLTEEARRRHNTSPVATAALGRLMLAGAMMGSMMKGEKDIVTLQIRCDGPIGGLVVTAGSDGSVKGYVHNPNVVIPSRAGKLDVGGALGHGVLSVMKDLGLKDPYSGQTELISGEIAEDLTYYFATSEQIPSSVGLGVLMNEDNTVRQAGGFLLQLMPFADEDCIAALEKKLAHLRPVTAMLDDGMTPEDILSELLGDQNLIITDTMPARFYCNCSKERVSRAISSIDRKDLLEMIKAGEPVQVHCHFCGADYTFSVEELKECYSQRHN